MNRTISGECIVSASPSLRAARSNHTLNQSPLVMRQQKQYQSPLLRAIMSSDLGCGHVQPTGYLIFSAKKSSSLAFIAASKATAHNSSRQHSHDLKMSLSKQHIKQSNKQYSHTIFKTAHQLSIIRRAPKKNNNRRAFFIFRLSPLWYFRFQHTHIV